MEKNTTEQSTPIADFRRSLGKMQLRQEDLVKAKERADEEQKVTESAFFAARYAAKEKGVTLPDRYMCGQWLFSFDANGKLTVTAIPNTEPYELLELARTIGEEAGESESTR